jgi:uncharacterized protein (TIGR03067 family)
MHALLFLALIASAPAPAEKEKEVPKELQAFQGVWKVIAVTQAPRRGSGGVAPVTDCRALVIVGDAFGWYGVTGAGTITVDPEKKEADLKAAEGAYKGQVIPALFEVSGDTLRLAVPRLTRTGSDGAPVAVERPKALNGRGGTNTVYTFERDTKATKEDAAAKLKEQKERIASRFGPGGANGPTAAANEALLKQLIERLDKIDKRLDELEKRRDKLGK